MIDLAPEQLAIVQRLLATLVPECEVRAFGSRVTGNAKPHSDLDLALIGPTRLPLARLAALREAFAESELPVRVDVLDWHAITEAFRNIITAKFDVLQHPARAVEESADRQQGSTGKKKGLGYGQK
jgi:predicted nucleotidyltransferase